MSAKKLIDLCKNKLEELLLQARMEGLPYKDIIAGELHKMTFGSPSDFNRMPICCDAMYNTKFKHEILFAPPKGKGSRLTIRYYLPLEPSNECVSTED